jgi:hypothetical protein
VLEVKRHSLSYFFPFLHQKAIPQGNKQAQKGQKSYIRTIAGESAAESTFPPLILAG